jgi:hypothetical protein
MPSAVIPISAEQLTHDALAFPTLRAPAAGGEFSSRYIMACDDVYDSTNGVAAVAYGTRIRYQLDALNRTERDHAYIGVGALAIGGQWHSVKQDERGTIIHAAQIYARSSVWVLSRLSTCLRVVRCSASKNLRNGF